MSAKRFIVRGRVQGVNFRTTAAQQALRLGLNGRIWNRDDGAVEAEAEGDVPSLAAFERWLHHGPALAEVEGVEAIELEVATPRRAFTIE